MENGFDENDFTNFVNGIKNNKRKFFHGFATEVMKKAPEIQGFLNVLKRFFVIVYE